VQLWRKNILLLTGLLALYSAAAQPDQRCKQTTYNSESGLPNQVIRSITEDENGFLWMITDNYVQWFDGSLFHQVPFGKGIHQVPGIQFSSILSTPEKEIWIFYDGGFSVYHPGTHTFSHYGSLIPGAGEKKFNPVAITAAELLIWTGDKIHFIHRKEKKISREMEWNRSVLLNPVPAAQLPAHILLADSARGFLFRAEKMERTSTFLPSTYGDISFHALTEKNWLFFYKDHLELVEIPGSSLLKKISYPGKKSVVNFSRPAFFLKKNESTLLVSLDEQLWEFDTEKMEFTRQIVNLSGKPFFENGYFKNAFYDQRGDLWAASNLNGLLKISMQSQPVQFTGTNNEQENFVKCFQVNKETNRIITGTYGKGLLVYDTTGNLLKRFMFDGPEEETNPIITTIGQIDNDQYLVFVYSSAKRYLLNTRTLSLRALKLHFEKGINDKAGSGYYAELIPLGNQQFSYSGTDRSFTFTFRNRELFCTKTPAVEVSRILKTGFVKTRYNKLTAYTGTSYFSQCLLKAGLTDWSATCLTKRNNNWLIGTIKGVFEFDSTQNLIHAYTKENGLTDEHIYAVILDAENNIWCSHDKGLSRIDQQGQVFNLNQQDGLQANEFNFGAAWKAPDGQLFFAGVKGLNSFYPAQLKSILDTPRIVISQISSNDLPVADTAYWNIKQMRFSHQQNRVRIRFSALGSNPASYYNYQYRVIGLDKAWKDLGHSLEINLALPPGEYSVEITGNHSFNPQLPPQQSIRLVIVPPFYKQWWFISLAALAFLSIAWFVFRFINKRKYQEKLKALEIQAELENERQRISRDLHDNMGAYTSALLANVEKMKGQQGEQEDLNKMKSNAEQILNSLRETIWVLNNKEISLADFSDGFKTYCFKLLRNFEQLEFEAEEDLEENNLLPAAVAIHLNKILQEAVQNILKHSKATVIRYHIRSSGKLVITLSDNGIGFDEAAVRKGNGLSNMRWRAAEANAEIVLSSTPGQGSTLRISR
jgi:signal transduction histidine kinase